MNPSRWWRVLLLSDLDRTMMAFSFSFWMVIALLGRGEVTETPKPLPLEQRRSACELFGTVYVDENPYRANYRVYVEEDEYSADLIVFKETNELMADQTGLWFFTLHPNFADFSIHYVENRSEANFTVFYTDIDAEARCNR